MGDWLISTAPNLFFKRLFNQVPPKGPCCWLGIGPPENARLAPIAAAPNKTPLRSPSFPDHRHCFVDAWIRRAQVVETGAICCGQLHAGREARRRLSPQYSKRAFRLRDRRGKVTVTFAAVAEGEDYRMRQHVRASVSSRIQHPTISEPPGIADQTLGHPDRQQDGVADLTAKASRAGAPIQGKSKPDALWLEPCVFSARAWRVLQANQHCAPARFR